MEKASGAARTYFTNLVSRDDAKFPAHSKLEVIKQAQVGLAVAPVSDVLSVVDEIDFGGGLDLVAGGPPCQGFSLAGRRIKDDPRNKLVWEFLSFVEKTNPRIVIIENVVGMGRKFDPSDEGSPFANVQEALATTKGAGYVVNGLSINAMHYGAPQFRPRLMVIGVRKDVADALEKPDRRELWASHFLDSKKPIPWFAPHPTRETAVTLEDAMAGLPGGKKGVSDSEYGRLMNDAGVWHLTTRAGKPLNNEMRRHRPPTVYRFQFAQLLAKMGLSGRALGPLAPETLDKELAKLDLYFKAHQDVELRAGERVFRTAAEVEEQIRALRNKKHSQRVLKWASPSHTVVTIPDDYIHPDQPRTFSVRELARLQGFPDDFEFMGKATTGGTDRRSSVPQYSQVGNAVSPLVGFAMGQLVERILGQADAVTESSQVA